MGFFNNMFGGGAEAEAADKNRALYGQYRTDGVAFLKDALGNAITSTGKGFTDANAALGQNKDIWSNYGTTANAAFDKGMNGSLSALGGAKADYNPLDALASKYGGASTMLLNSLGVNGAAGNDAAVGAYRAGPGYDYSVSQAMDAINRRRAAGGMMNSGNADIDALKMGKGLADADYGSWQTKLAGFAPMEAAATTTAATGRAGVDTNLANLYATDASNRAGVAGNVATGTAGANSAMAGNDMAHGLTDAGLYSGYGSDLTNLYGNVASGDAAANNMEAAGKEAGMKNLAGLGQSLFGSALKFAGGGGFSGLGAKA